MNSPPPIPSSLDSRTSRRAPLVPILIILAVVLGVSVITNVILIKKRQQHSAHGHWAEDQYPTYEEQWSYGVGEAKVLRISLQGVIARESDAGFLEMPVDRTEQVLRQIRAATQDEDMRAIIMEIDSPGGMIGPSDEMYRALMRFKERDDHPRVLSFTRDLSASGGYYVSLASDWIMAEPTAVVGSIGVIMQSMNLQGLSEKIGIEDVTIKSGENKDLLNPFRETKPEQLALLQEVIDSMYQRFRGLVQEHRGISDEELDRLADGRIFSAQAAVEEKLIDEVGYWDDLMLRTADLLGEDEVRVVRYLQAQSFLESLFQAQISPRLPAFLDRFSGPAFYMLWKP